MNKLILNDNNQLVIPQEIIQEVVKIIEKTEMLENKLAEIKNAIKYAMEEHQVKSFENELLKILYVEPTEKVIVDTEKLKTEYEEVYIQCSKKSQVKSSIRLKIK